MIGRILFLSAAAFLAYRYIGRSNKKARELRQQKSIEEITPPAIEESATIVQPQGTSAVTVSPAAEPHPGR